MSTSSGYGRTTQTTIYRGGTSVAELTRDALEHV